MSDRDRARARLRDHPLLVAITSGASALETLLIVMIGPSSAAALGPQVSAPAPYGVYHDLRWLLVYHSSWVGFVLEVAVLLGIRTAIDTVATLAAWPADVERPPWREHTRYVAGFSIVQAVVLVLFAELAFAMAFTSLSWLFFVSVPVLLIVTVLVHHGAVDRRWWRDPPTRASVGAALLVFVVLTIGGGVIAVVPEWLMPVLAAGVGVPVAWCRLRIVDSLTHRPAGAQSPRAPYAVVGLVGVLVLVIGGTASGFAVATAVENGRTPLPVAAGDATGPPVLVVKGFNSKWDGVTRQWVSGNYRIRRFSYRGLDGNDRPRAYDRSDTHRSVRALVGEMRDQVEALHDETGRAVRIVAESEGALVTQAYLSGVPDAPVRAVVLLSPLIAPGRVAYPALGHEGWGVVAGTVLHGLTFIVGAVGPVEVSPDTPLFRSIVEEEPALGALLGCPPPGIRSFAILPLDSGVSAPAPLHVRVRHAVVPAFHGGLLGDTTSADLLGRVFRGRRAQGSGAWAFVGDVVNAGAAPWQVPSLESSLESGSAIDADDCPAVRAELRRWLGTSTTSRR
jgi:hypothetical protein